MLSFIQPQYTKTAKADVNEKTHLAYQCSHHVKPLRIMMVLQEVEDSIAFHFWTVWLFQCLHVRCSLGHTVLCSWVESFSTLEVWDLALQHWNSPVLLLGSVIFIGDILLACLLHRMIAIWKFLGHWELWDTSYFWLSQRQDFCGIPSSVVCYSLEMSHQPVR